MLITAQPIGILHDCWTQGCWVSLTQIQVGGRRCDWEANSTGGKDKNNSAKTVLSHLSGKTANLDLAPVKSVQNKCSFVQNMVKRYVFFRDSLPSLKIAEIDELFLSFGKQREVNAISLQISKVDSVTKRLRREDKKPAQVCIVFDIVIEHAPNLFNFLSFNTDSVENKHFKSALWSYQKIVLLSFLQVGKRLLYIYKLLKIICWCFCWWIVLGPNSPFDETTWGELGPRSALHKHALYRTLV